MIGLAVILPVAACGSDADDTVTGDDGAAGGTDAPAGDAGGDPTGDAGDDTSLPPPIGAGDGAVIGTIDIVVTHPDAEPVSYSIGCLGDAFPVTPEVEGVTGDAACERLADPAVLDRLVNGVPAGQACTEIYGGPDVAEITGELNGEAIDASIDRANGCGMNDWDELLADVLPPAIGVS
jgi:hypothetical protein